MLNDIDLADIESVLDRLQRLSNEAFRVGAPEFDSIDKARAFLGRAYINLYERHKETA